MISYNQDNSIMMSIEMIKNKMLQKECIDIPNDIKKQVCPTRIKNEKQHENLTLDEYKNDSSVIMVIRSDPRLLYLLLSCRKHKSLLAYLYIENHQYITLFVKYGNSFPIVILKIPISNVFAYAVKTEICYEFPISSIISKIPKNKTLNYTLILKKTYSGNELKFEINNGIHKSDITLDNIKTIQLQYLTILFSNKLQNISDSITTFGNILNNIQIAALNVIPTNSDLINILQNTKNTGNISFVIRKDELFIEETKFNLTENIILFSSNINSRLYWNYLTLRDDMKFNIINIENIFKLNYNKISSNKSKLYFVFASIGNTFVFLKVFTPIIISRLNDEKPYLFSNLFNKESQIIEIFNLSVQ